MKIQLSDHFNYHKLLRFCLPSVIMMVFTSIYGVVDGLFISNFVGKVSFAAINLIMPFNMILGGVGFMIGTGGSALVAKTLGEGKKELANKYFSMMILLTIILGVILSALGIIIAPYVAKALGANQAMLGECVTYARTLLIFNFAFMLQNVFQSFLVTAERPKMGLAVTVAAGLTNMILDALFIAVFKWGVSGAALATGISQCVGGLLPLIFFLNKNNGSRLTLVKTKLKIKPIMNACTNGVSELMSNISTSLVSMLYNIQLMKVAGENGVAAYGVIMYVQFVFIGIFIGYSIGTAPIVGYNYGAQNSDEVKNMRHKSTVIMSIAGITMMLLAQIFASTISNIFVGYDKSLFELTEHAFRLFSFSFVLAGLNIYVSSFFTALNNGLISAVVSFFRTLVFQSICVLVLPLIFGANGIWLANTAAEICAFAISQTLLFINRKKYHYM